MRALTAPHKEEQTVAKTDSGRPAIEVPTSPALYGNVFTEDGDVNQRESTGEKRAVAEGLLIV